MSITSDRAFNLLPGIIRERDIERGNPLAALFSVLAREGTIVEDDIARLFDNLFIETCDEWVVPYLGDLLGVRGLNDTGSSQFSNRSRVANTLAYRRRKGTASMLEQLALDSTGWRARVVENFELLATTQWLNHLRMHSLQTPDLRRGDSLERLGSAFEDTRHFVDVRRIGNERGRYNIPNVSVFLWRLDSQPLADRATACVGVAGTARSRFFIDPLGIDTPCFNSPATEHSISSVAGEVNVPGVLRRRPLAAETERLRDSIVNSRPTLSTWFGRTPVLSVWYKTGAADQLIEIPPEQIIIANLSAPDEAFPTVWQHPATTVSVPRLNAAPVDLPIAVAIDPVLGRISFPKTVVPHEVRVTAARGFPGDIGGGAYDRRASVAEWALSENLWHVAVGRTAQPISSGVRQFDSFASAIAEWNLQPGGAVGLVTFTENNTYRLADDVKITLKKGSRLYITSAGVPNFPSASGGETKIPGRFTPSEIWSHLAGNIKVESQADTELTLDGLLIEGNVTLLKGVAGLERLRLSHSTIVPKRGTLTVEKGHDELRVELCRVVSGAIEIRDAVRSICVTDSVVDGAGTLALAANDVAAQINGSTIVGPVEVQQLDASNSIFVDAVKVQRRQTGCVRFSFIAQGSEVPRRYRCQPDLALENANPLEGDAIVARMVPDFTGESYGNPAYLQLTRTTPEEIRTGADDGAEMGAWWFLRQPQREANLRSSLDEYLRLGLEAGLFFVT